MPASGVIIRLLAVSMMSFLVGMNAGVRDITLGAFSWIDAACSISAGYYIGHCVMVLKEK